MILYCSTQSKYQQFYANSEPFTVHLRNQQKLTYRIQIRIKLKNYEKSKSPALVNKSPTLTNKSSLSSTLNFNETQTTFKAKFITNRLLSTQQKYRSHSRNSDRQNYQEYLRPHTQLKERATKSRNNAYTPLQIINTKMSDSEKDFQLTKIPGSLKRLGTRISLRPKSCSYSHSNLHKSQPKIKQFLKKGTSINKSILLNIFKSKFNQNISSSPYSYSDKNPSLINIISKAIPKPLKDIIGPQQMLKMSRIMTGLKIKPVSLQHNIIRAIATSGKDKIHQKRSKIEEDDNQTLKSIKRW